MKEIRIPPPPAFDWKAGGWPLLAAAGGIGMLGVLGYAMGMFGKDEKMTKLEKACVAVLVALGEKVEELEKEKSRLVKEVADADRKLVAETHRAENAEAQLMEANDRIARGDARVRVLEDKLKELERSPTKSGRR